MKSFYRGPQGDTRENPDAEFLRHIADTPSTYWAKGGGDSCLEVSESDERMIFFYDDPYGFFVMMHPDYKVVCRDLGPIITVEHRVGGEPMRVPSCSYFNREEAYILMLEFIKTGQQPKSMEWVNMYDIQFDHGF